MQGNASQPYRRGHWPPGSAGATQSQRDASGVVQWQPTVGRCIVDGFPGDSKHILSSGEVSILWL